MEAKRAHVDPAVGEQRGKRAERLRQRLRVRIGVHEHERPPRLDRDGDERDRPAVEGVLLLRSRRAAERAVEVVRPRVVAALDRLPPVGGLAEDVAAVPAHVDEAAELAVLPADEEHRQGARPGRCHRARLGDELCTCRVLPRAREDAVLLDP